MRFSRSLLAVALIALLARPSFAASPVTVTFGSSIDGATHDLQHIVNARYGAGRIHVTTDFIGAHAGQPDPWYWNDSHFAAFLVTEIAGNSDRNIVGWSPSKTSTAAAWWAPKRMTISTISCSK